MEVSAGAGSGGAGEGSDGKGDEDGAGGGGGGGSGGVNSEGAPEVASGLAVASGGNVSLALNVAFDMEKDKKFDEGGIGTPRFALGTAVHLLPFKLVIDAPAGRLAFVAIITK